MKTAKVSLERAASDANRTARMNDLLSLWFMAKATDVRAKSVPIESR